MAAPFETFPALRTVAGLRHAFTGRAPGVDVKMDREAALRRLDASHAAVREQLGFGGRTLLTADQVHGKEVLVVDSRSTLPLRPADGLITADLNVCLSVYVADCCAVYLVDVKARVIGLLHSGRKGSELGITAAAIQKMREEFGCQPENMIVQLSPCIRPPDYEMDFARLIVQDCEKAGVEEVADCGISTARNLEQYYSYRAEQGKTGRMLALLGLTQV